MTRVLMTLLSLALLLPVATVLPVATAQAQDTDSERYAARAVQERRYYNQHQITVYGGTLPLDAFEKGITLGGSYTLHFDELIAWEVAHFAYSFPVATDLRAQLENFDIMETPFEVVEWFLTSNLVLTPIYWKASLANDSLLHGEFFFTLGAGLANLTRVQQLVAEAGLGSRFYLSETFSAVIDFRYQAYFSDQTFQNGNLRSEIWIGLGLTAGI